MTYPPPPPPPQPDYFRATDNEGALMVFRVKQFEQQYSGWTEPQAAVRCDIEAIDPPAGPWHDAWVGNELIVMQLRDSIGKTFYARLVKRGRAFVLDPIHYGDEEHIDIWKQMKQRGAEQSPPLRPATGNSTGDILRRTRVNTTIQGSVSAPGVPVEDDVPF